MNLQKQWMCPDCHKTTRRSVGKCHKCGDDVTSSVKKAPFVDCDRLFCREYDFLIW
jgi:predicted ATP-dependent serine protease